VEDSIGIEFVDKAGKPRDMVRERLARLLWGENSSVTDEEAMLIGDSVLNRVESPRWPDTITDVIQQKNQYHPFSGEGPNFERVMAFNETNEAWPRYMELAGRILDPNRQRSDVTHYFTGKVPVWAKDMQLKNAGSHRFGRERALDEGVIEAFKKRRTRAR